MLTDQEFTDFVRTRGPAMLRTASFLAGNRADGEDLLQQSLVNAYPKLRRIEAAGALESYVRTTMVRASISTSRKAFRRRETTTAAVPDSIERPDPLAIVDDRDQLFPLLHRLSPQQRAVVVLRYYHDLTEAQIAAELSCSTGAVKSHASRALTRLRELLPAHTSNGREGDPR